jgi:hypothetical protein
LGRGWRKIGKGPERGWGELPDRKIGLNRRIGGELGMRVEKFKSLKV